jgi:transcription elongation factor Elf1
VADQAENGTEIRETDIVFDCPHCGKSLAIDYRGAGLTIPCSDCGVDVQVPIPEGMQLTDIDSTEEEQEIRILNLRRSLHAAEYRIRQLKAELESTTEERDSLQKARTGDSYAIGVVIEQAEAMESALQQLSESVDKILKAVRRQA